jgi:hypothetical protein
MKVNQHEDFSYGELVVGIARLFLHKPYETGSLEQPGRERLMVNLSAFDCTTFVETVLALARCADRGKISSQAFLKQLKSIRYRQGKINGYASRLHYFSDWLQDNEKMNFVADRSKDLGGIPHRKKIHFMTTHQALYPALKNKAQRDRMLTIEKNLSRRVLHILDHNTVKTQATKIKNGDILAFTSKQEGLDVAHVGFAVREGKGLRLLHASKKEGRVVISKKTVVSYLKANKNFTGIIIAKSIGHF